MLKLRSLLRIAAWIAAVDFIIVSSHTDSCEASSSITSSSLLQAKAKRSPAASAKDTQVNSGLMTHDQNSSTRQFPGVARATLPPHLLEVGLQLFQTEEILDALVANTVEQVHTYAGVAMTIRMVIGDGVDGDDSYGIANLSQSLLPADGQIIGGMLSMLDIGGNYGRVSIATFKLFPANLRVITVEPVPSTYFILRWNLWLNGVPELEQQEFVTDHSKPGVLALNNGIENVDDKLTGFCHKVPETMASKICNCSEVAGSEGWYCVNIISKSLNTLVSLLGVDEITFLKMDCEGCEFDVIPAVQNLQATTGLRVHRFAGELHAMPNELEDFACQAEGAQWFVSVCYLHQQAKFAAIPTRDRCIMGPTREGCNRIPYEELLIKRPPPSEWYQKGMKT